MNEDLCASNLHNYVNGACIDCKAKEPLKLSPAPDPDPEPPTKDPFHPLDYVHGSEFLEVYAGAALGGLLTNPDLDFALATEGADAICRSAWTWAEALVRNHPRNQKWTCQVCGCTDERACVDVASMVCHWVAPNLCSACVERLRVSTAEQRAAAVKGGAA